MQTSSSIANPIRPLAAVLLLAVGLLSACGKTGGDEAPEAAAFTREGAAVRVPEGSPLRASLAVAPVETRNMARAIAAPGLVQADPLRLAKVAPPASGKLQQVFVKLGQTVKKGDPLFSLDSPDVDQAIADQARSQSALLLSRKSVERQRDFLAHGISAEQDVEIAEDGFAQATAESRRAQARLNGLGFRNDNPSDPSILTIRAPADGSVVELTASPGTYINDVAAPLVTLADISQVVVSAQLPERDLGFVKPGIAASLSFAAFPGQPFTGTVSSVSDVIAADTRRAAVLIPLANSGKQLKPGMFAAVTLEEPQQPRLVVPATALLQDRGENAVYVEAPAWSFTLQPVTVDYQQDETVVISKGLKAGDRVLIKGGVLIHAQ